MPTILDAALTSARADALTRPRAAELTEVIEVLDSGGVTLYGETNRGRTGVTRTEILVDGGGRVVITKELDQTGITYAFDSIEVRSKFGQPVAVARLTRDARTSLFNPAYDINDASSGAYLGYTYGQRLDYYIAGALGHEEASRKCSPGSDMVSNEVFAWLVAAIRRGK